MKNLLILLILTISLALVNESSASSISDEDLDFAIIELYAVDIIKHDTLDKIYVDPYNWELLTPDNKKFVAYMFAVKKTRSGVLTLSIIIYDHESGEEITRYYFSAVQEGTEP